MRTLVKAEGVGDGQTSGAERRIAGGHGQHHDAEDGKGSAERAEQFHGNIVHDQRGVALGTESGGESGGIGVEGHAERHPDQADDAFGDHRAVENLAAMLFIVDATGHQRRLRSVETGTGTAGDGDEHQRPRGQTGGALRRPFDVVVEGIALEDEGAQQPHGHEHQQDGEERINTTDDLVHGQNGGEEVVREDDRHKNHAVHTGQVSHQTGGTGDEDHAHENKQNHGEHAHQLLDGVAEVVSDDVGHGLAAVPDGQHPGEVVMHGSGEHAADNHPQQGDGAVQSAQNRTEHGAETGNVQQLNQKDLGGTHLHIVHTVGHLAGGRRPIGIRAEHLFHKSPVHEVPTEQTGKRQHKIHP